MLIDGEEKDCCDYSNTIIRHKPNGKPCPFNALPMQPEWAHVHATDDKCPVIEIECTYCGENDINSFFANTGGITCREGDTDLVSEGEMEPSLDNIQPLAENGFPWPRMKISQPSRIRINGPDINAFCKTKGRPSKALLRCISTFINYLRNDGRLIQIVFSKLSKDSLEQIRKFCSSKFLDGLDTLLQNQQMELLIVIGEDEGWPINSQEEAFERLKDWSYDLRNPSTN